MAPFSLPSALLLSAYITSLSLCDQIDSQLVGTWSSKSGKVLTGPDFYNPVNDTFIEPDLPGISYSFHADGYWESAFYVAVSNPTTPSCPQGMLQFQHGTIVQNSDQSLDLTPFGVDGRQLQSNPCADTKRAVYTRYNQSETFAKWAVYTDPYHKILRLDLYNFDGSPMNPMYQAFSPPQMLPTTTMNPTAGAATATGKAKRWFGSGGEEEGVVQPLNKGAKHVRRDGKVPLYMRIDATHLFWTAIGMLVFGAALMKVSKM